MSEPMSLYCRVKISKAAYQKYLSDPPTKPSTYSDWKSWLENKRMVGSISAEDIQSLSTQYDHIGSVSSHLQGWLDADMTLGRTTYDVENETWIFALAQFSENYLDMLGMLSILRGVEKYLAANEQGRIIIFPYFWEQNATAQAAAVLEIAPGRNDFLETPSEDFANEADLYLKKLFDELVEINHDFLSWKKSKF